MLILNKTTDGSSSDKQTNTTSHVTDAQSSEGFDSDFVSSTGNAEGPHDSLDLLS